MARLQPRAAVSLLVVLGLGSAFAAPNQPPSAAPAAPALAPNEIRSRAQNTTFQLVTKIKTGTEKQSYGTAFAVFPNGLLATNFHVVSNVVESPARYELQLIAGTEAIPAKVVAFDVPNDLALVQVNRFFQQVVDLAKTFPVPGERLYSIGIPEDTVLTIVDGLFSGKRTAGAVTRTIFSAPLNHGMSGGPVVNSVGEVVGVNDAMLAHAQDISLAIPEEMLLKLMTTVIDKGRAPASVNSQNSVMDQVQNVLTPWIGSWKSSVSSHASSPVGNARVTPPPPGAKCWEDEKREATGFKIGAYSCATQDTFPISTSQTGGFLGLHYYWVEGTGSVSAVRSVMKGDILESTIKNAALSKYAQSAGQGGVPAKFVCHHRHVTSGSSEKLMVEYCTNESFAGSGLYDLILTATPAEKTNMFVAEMDLKGFDEENLKAASQLFLDGIQSGSEQ